jgi:hypothetical protein
MLIEELGNIGRKMSGIVEGLMHTGRPANAANTRFALGLGWGVEAAQLLAGEVGGLFGLGGVHTAGQPDALGRQPMHGPGEDVLVDQIKILVTRSYMPV